MSKNTRTEVIIRFNEVDSMEIVWHGNYVKYLEDGREDFGRKYGIGYLDVQKAGYGVPIVNIELHYKKVIRYGERVIVETTYVSTEAAKLIFDYKIFNAKSQIVCTARTVQVFLDKNHRLQLIAPDFYEKWRAEYLEMILQNNNTIIDNNHESIRHKSPYLQPIRD
jgi:acyl-CoA thioester hydrolase